ncbi:hypothetical protein [Sorangium sp. So ce381]|uniref:hypothetical protein n=1 Tax=Sorangium sp. So ce381 TaxID=3133307 RepID=UPI003F5B3875
MISASSSLDGRERAELYTALLVMAAIDPWGHHLMKELVMGVGADSNGIPDSTFIERARA